MIIAPNPANDPSIIDHAVRMSGLQDLDGPVERRRVHMVAEPAE